ncbi:unnamed protein product [Rotaria socialis]|uniref:G-protein coupled receptors family 1 profile domain-containing protein n=1 Tax=Rotaria socialis TaxID=392032 RepID=A0A818KA35_9BILA|nr:unnamed protein product [Rotaria socialis]CAF3421071.1 unnamed protein product [Rotaria socialis]CAF3554123.1 unnamed protein product [Rotaria socialis]CAF3780930.1 unnamed protein product [Rotaria socialis]CAF4440406.1 unnamed protein product [Rotaria socialis]
MSSNSSKTDIILNLILISAQINRYFSIVILLFGTIGNILNCLVLSQKSLRSNPCSWLFLASSISSLITLISGVAVRLLTGWSADLTNTVPWLCKLRIFVLFVSRTIASWLIMLATVDRWFSSSIDVNRRHMSKLENAQLGTLLVVILSSLAYTQIFYCYEANLTNAPLECYGRTIWCRLLIDFTFATIGVIIPSILMLSFGIMTILNIRVVAKRRIQPASISIETQVTTNGQQPRWKKSDRHLIVMLLVQVVLLTLFSLPQVIQNIYANSTMYLARPQLQIGINNFIFNLFLLLTYVTNGMPFYIYTLAGGSIFRKALYNILKQLTQKILCRKD